MGDNIFAFTVSSVVCLVHLEGCKSLARRRICKQSTSRKLIHIGCGLQYLLLWPLYADDASAKFWCGAVPLIATLRYLVVGLGLFDDKALVLSTSRTGRREELLKGPVVYGIVHGLAAILFWRNSGIGIAIIAFLCAGDGLAEVVGSRFGPTNPLPHNPRKSWAGSLTCLTAGFCSMLSFLQYFRWLGLSKTVETADVLAIKLVGIATAGAAIESVALAEWDNLTDVGFASKRWPLIYDLLADLMRAYPGSEAFLPAFFESEILL